MTSDVNINRGDDVTIEVTAQDQNGDAINITGATITFNIYKTNAGTLVDSFATGGDGVTIITGAAGRFNVDIPRTLTEDLAEESYFFEAEILDSNNKKTTLKRKDFSNPVLAVYPDLIV